MPLSFCSKLLFEGVANNMSSSFKKDWVWSQTNAFEMHFKTWVKQLHTMQPTSVLGMFQTGVVAVIYSQLGTPLPLSPVVPHIQSSCAVVLWWHCNAQEIVQHAVMAEKIISYRTFGPIALLIADMRADEFSVGQPHDISFSASPNRRRSLRRAE